MKNILRGLFAFFLGLFLYSCNKKLEVISSRIQNDEGSWNSFEDARAGLIGAYALTRAALAADNGHWMYGELRMGEFESTSRLDLKAIINNELTTQFPLLKRLSNWTRFYAAINACNLFIEKSDSCRQDAKYSDNYHKLDLAQIRALRAYLYFYISRIWGDVPLLLISNDGGNFVPVKRTRQDIVLSFIEKEILDIQNFLPDAYNDARSSTGYIPNYYNLSGFEWNDALIDKIDLYALLTHLFVWQGRYSEANAAVNLIIEYYKKYSTEFENEHLKLAPGIKNNFSGDNKSLNINSIFGFQFLKKTGEYTTDGHIENLTLAKTPEYFMSKPIPDIYIPKAKIIDLFANKAGIYDQRFGLYTTERGIQKYTSAYFENFNTGIPVFKKIRFADGNSESGKYPKFNSSLIFSRPVEIYLLAAEINFVTENFDAGLVFLNKVRISRGVDIIGAVPKKGAKLLLLKELHNERKRELMGEAWSWYDNIRLKRIEGTDAEFNKLILSGGIYWPVDESIIASNPEIEQQQYWK